MSGSGIVVSDGELRRFIIDALVAGGAGGADAAVVADGLVWANLRGVDGHGVSRLPSYLAMIARGEIDPKAQPRFLQERAATFVLDGGRGLRSGRDDAGDQPMPPRRRRNAGVCFGAGARDDAHRRDRPLCAMDRGARLRRDHHGRGSGLRRLSRRACRQPGNEPDRHRACPAASGRSCSTWRRAAISNGRIMQARTTGAALPPVPR